MRLHFLPGVPPKDSVPNPDTNIPGHRDQYRCVNPVPPKGEADQAQGYALPLAQQESGT